jgi:AraC family transcriptional regulator of adaptative response / DNA-3-methyladenine glycosylase II
MTDFKRIDFKAFDGTTLRGSFSRADGDKTLALVMSTRPAPNVTPIDGDRCYDALLARDYRFDGSFFIGVKTTGIYCRPICPGRPKRENVEFFGHATAAETSGYRPCLRCRPEDAPLTPNGCGSFGIVRRSLEVIAGGGSLITDADAVASWVGVPVVELRRRFEEEVGKDLDQVIRNSRLDFARKLVVETSLPLATIADIAAFPTMREFSEAFESRFRRPPDALGRPRKQSGDEEVELLLSYRPPLDWPALLNFYRAHQIAGLETVDEASYGRVFKLGSVSGAFRVLPERSKPQLRLRIFADDPRVLFTVAQRVRRMFNLDSDPLLVAKGFSSHKVLGPLWEKYPGLRVARGWDPFETAICTILGQLVSTNQGRALVRQLVEGYGESIAHPVTGERSYLGPSAETLARADLTGVSTSQARKRAIRELSGLVATGTVDLDGRQDARAVKERLLALPGIGPWTSEYIGLRALGDTDSFPRTDLVLKRTIEQYTDLDFEAVRPWRGYAAVCLWAHHSELAQKKENPG